MDHEQPHAQAAPQDISGRIMGHEVNGNKVVLAISAGSEEGAAVGMRGYLTNDSGRPAMWFKLYRVEPSMSWAEVDGTVDDVKAQPKPVLNPSTSSGAAKAVQRASDGHVDADYATVHALSGLGIAGPGGPLPYLDTIQRSFGSHDVSGVVAHTDGAAAQAATAMGATAYATGNHVAFAGTPDLHTAAHEAAHVVQQRVGVHLKGGIGEAGDAYERHADAVADAVVRGESAENLLESAGETDAGTSAPQHDPAVSGLGDEGQALSNASSIIPTVQRQPAPQLQPPTGSSAPLEGGLATPTDLERDLRSVLANWRNQAQVGVIQFATADLVSRIESIESGSWRNFLQTMIGGTIWCATAYLTGGTSFAIGMAGMHLQALTGLPSQSGDGLGDVQEMFLQYIEAGHKRGKDQAAQVTANTIAANKGITRNRAIGKILQQSFKPSLITVGDYSTMPDIDETKMRTIYRDAGTDLLSRFRAQINPIGQGDKLLQTTTVVSIDGRLAQVERNNALERFHQQRGMDSPARPYRFLMWISDDLRDSALAAVGGTAPIIPRNRIEGLWTFAELQGIGDIEIEAAVWTPYRMPLTILRSNWKDVSREKERFVQEQFPGEKISALACPLDVKVYAPHGQGWFRARSETNVLVPIGDVRDKLIHAAQGANDPQATEDQKVAAAENSAKAFAYQLYNMPISKLDFGK
jgi:Domain of unknown function (DUF4157)